MLKQSPFFEFFNRRPDPSFTTFESTSIQDEDYSDWNGHLRPYDYGDAETEYRAVRNECAFCDVSPMRKIRITGKDATALLDVLLTRQASTLDNYRAQYVVFCNEDGTLKDDAILYKFSETDYLLLPSDIDHSPYFKTVANDHGLTEVGFTESTSSLAGLALQGPCSADVASEMGFSGIESLEPFEIRNMDINGREIMVARMGFTADLGFEFWIKPEDTGLFQELIKSVRQSTGLAIQGYGLSALEACRIEGGFVVAGWDFATEVDDAPGFERAPSEVGLAWTVDMKGADFIGKESLTKIKGQTRYLIRRLSTNIHADLEGLDIFASIDGEERIVGSVNCATWSWGQRATIGNASIFRGDKDVTDAWVLMEGERIKIELQKGGFVNFPRRNEVPAPLNVSPTETSNAASTTD